MTDLLTTAWRRREPPLTPAALWAPGEVAARLAQRLLGDPRREALRGVGVEAEDADECHGLLLLGPPEALPWLDGVIYLGCPSGAPSILLPTLLVPGFAEELLERACRRIAAPVAVLPPGCPGGPARISAAEAREPSRRALERWSAGSEEKHDAS